MNFRHKVSNLVFFDTGFEGYRWIPTDLFECSLSSPA